MKQADVKIGGIYLTRVSGQLVSVEVVRSLVKSIPGYRDRTVFQCRHLRQDRAGGLVTTGGEILPKSRTAAALRPVPAPVKGGLVEAMIKRQGSEPE